MAIHADKLSALRKDLDGLVIEADPRLVRQKSRDFFWYSPVLKRQLDDVCGDLLVSPRNETDVLQTLAACHRHDVPVTARGRGTGNYGQAMPLAGGVVLNLADMDKVLHIDKGRITAEPGALLSEIDAQAIAQTDQEMRMFPSTYRTASIGGFIAGGSGGVGSITWGGLRDLGNVMRLKLATMEASPRILELTGDNVHKANHAYGTTGVILEAEIPLAAHYDWVELIVAFDEFMPAVRFADALAREDAILKKLVTPIAAPVPYDYFRKHRDFFRRDQHVVLLMIAPHALSAFQAFCRHWREAEIVYRSDDGVARSGWFPIYELSWNHTTLMGLRVDKNITYLQVLYPNPDHVALVEKMHRYFGDEVVSHLEFVRFNGATTCFGLPIVRYSNDARLEEIMRFHEDHGCPIFNPHRYTLEEGGMKQTDAVQLAFKREADPKGLLNPGKMVAWDNPDFDFSSQRTYLFPGIKA